MNCCKIAYISICFLSAFSMRNVRAEDMNNGSLLLDDGRLKELRIHVGDSVRVISETHGTMAGRLNGSRIDLLLIDHNDRVEQIDFQDIDQLWVLATSTEKGLKRGALFGSIAGGAIVPAIMKFISLGADEGGSYTTNDFLLHFSTGAIIGAAGGTLIGYLIGHNSVHWELRYQGH